MFKSFLSASVVTSLLIICGSFKVYPNQFLKTYEDSLVALHQAIASELNHSAKLELNKKFNAIFFQALSIESSFDYHFEGLKNVGKISSRDGMVRVFTWNIPLAGGLHRYFGFIQFKHKGSVQLFTLNDDRKNFEVPQIETTNHNKWFGALYYHIQDVSFGGTTYYTLLGVDFNNLLSTKRVVEILSFNSKGEPVLGHPIISVRGHNISRIIFEYSSQANMILRYDERSKMIVFDHLAPSRNDFHNHFQFYGPDMTFDGLIFENGRWVYVPNIDIRNPEKKNRPKPMEKPDDEPVPGFLYLPQSSKQN